MFDNSNLSVTTTALARPDILFQTYSSFSKNLIGVNFKDLDLFINIDPIPNDMGAISEAIKVAKSFFNQVYWHISNVPNFTSAINWCWSTAYSEFILHLEDDWVLFKSIDAKLIWNCLSADIIQVIFRAYDYRYDKIPLSPSILKNTFYKSVGGRLDSNINPEVQLRGNKIYPFDKAKFIVFGENSIVCDIGRHWSMERGLKKPVKSFFTTYEGYNNANSPAA